MHEMGIAMQIIEIATASIPDDMAGARVAKINLKVGQLSAVVPDSLRFCFEIASQDTPLGAAELNIEEVPVVIHCEECQARWTIDEPIFTCRKCGSGEIKVVSGRELDIDSIELEEKDTANADKIV